jgi:3-hydroxyisobutyrate dehydrogenase-like beta-hydroxyacid dehydrogenase/alkylhydroperoxidase/carboxymuconolactone decarboxylase family protein YurZ
MSAQEQQEPTTETTRLRAGVIGLGMIGGGVASALAAHGFPPTVFDVRPDAVARVEGVSEQVATPADVARASDVVMIAVVDARQAEEVLVGEDGLLTAGREGLVVVLLSTVAISAVHDLAGLCAERGATLLDAGVTQAGEAGLVVMLGGADEPIARATPVVEGFAQAVIHCGELGAGMATKLARNVVTYASWAVLREAAAIAAANGVDPERLLDVMRAAGDKGPTPTSMLQAQVAGQGLPPEQVGVVDHLAQKDLAAAQEFAGQAGVQTPIVDVVRGAMPAVLSGEYAPRAPEDRWERGVEMMHRVYGPGPGDQVQGMTDNPAIADTVEHLFAEIWDRGHLTTRDRRLLTIGATTVLGRGDLLETQLRGGIVNRELTTAQLRELELFMNYYAGIGNGTALLGAVEKLVAESAGTA